MINPTFNTTVTLYHQIKHIDDTTKRTVTEWKRSVHTECFYKVEKAEKLNGNTLSQASSYMVRIPFKGSFVEVADGDIIVKGAIPDELADVQGQRATDLLQKYKPGCFTVRTVSDNTKMPYGSHYKLTGV